MAKEQKIADIENMGVAEAVAALNKVYGENTIIVASQAIGVDIQHISTGAYALDFALGGGFPKNRIVEIRGPFSSFKSTISLMATANFQRNEPTGMGLYVDVEKTFDRVYAQRLGVDLERLLLVNPDSGEQAVDVMNDALRLRVPIWAVLDSVAALVPTAELDASMDQQSMGLQARLINRAMRVLTARMKRSLYDSTAPSTTVLALNQLREKIGVVYGNPETTPGGKGKDFFYSTIVRLSASAAKANIISEEVTVNSVKRAVRYGQVVDFRVIKNKAGGPQNEEGQFTYYERPYAGHAANTINNAEALFQYGAFLDIIQLTDDGFEFEDLCYKKENKFIAALQARPKLQRILYKRILAKLRPDVETKTKVKIL